MRIESPITPHPPPHKVSALRLSNVNHGITNPEGRNRGSQNLVSESTQMCYTENIYQIFHKSIQKGSGKICLQERRAEEKGGM